MKKFVNLAVAAATLLLMLACGGGDAGGDKPAKATKRPRAAAGYKAGAVTDGGSISGRVTFAGAIPQAKKLEVTKDANVCGKKAHYDESVVISDSKGLANVVVKITGITAGKELEAGDYVLDQNGCAFEPHVSLVPAGSALTIKNSDGILHNIHTFSEVNKSVNVAQPGFKKVMKQTFEKPEIVRIACDVHNWMTGYVVVSDHPYYAITGADGSFEMTNVPAGNYTVEYWQESLGKQTRQVTVAAGGAADGSAEYAAGS